MRRTIIAAAVALVTLAPAAAQDTPDRAAIEEIVREYLLANPELLYEMQARYEAKQEAERSAQARETLAERREEVFASPHQTSIGPADADVTVVEFFDYNCGYCARALEDMNALLEADPKLRFVLKEVPIIRPESVGAHRVSLAVHKLAPEVYAEFHNRLFAVPGVKTDQAALEIAVELGVDEEKLRERANAEEITEAFRHATGLAEALGVTGTPSYVVGDELVFGALGQDVLKAKIEAMRECGRTDCSEG